MIRVPKVSKILEIPSELSYKFDESHNDSNNLIPLDEFDDECKSILVPTNESFDTIFKRELGGTHE